VSRLRQLLLGAGAVAALVVGWAWIEGARAAGLLLLGLYAVIVLVLLLIERARYKPILAAPPGAPWRETSERFVDPESGKLVVVWEHPGSGQRAYVEGTP
jgi:hypothetical protein